MATAKDCHVLTSYYVKLYKAKYHSEPVVNRHSARWGFDSILLGMSPQEIKELLEYYLTTASAKRHALEWFFYNYEKLINGRTEVLADRIRRARLRHESEQRAKEWRERGNERITNHQQRLEE